MNSLRIGILLGLRQIQRTNVWTNILIIFVMMLTFLNLVAVSGILVGLIEGAAQAVKEQSTGDIIIRNLSDEDHIVESPQFIRRLESFPEIEVFSPRGITTSLIEANYQNRDLGTERDSVNAFVSGIIPERENAVTHLSDYLIEGEYLDANESGYVLIGSLLLEEYVEGFGDQFDSLSKVEVGDKVRIQSGQIAREFTVKGIIKTKVDEVSFKAFMTEDDFNTLFKRLDRSLDEISIIVKDEYDVLEVRKALSNSGLSEYASIQTADEAEPKFLTDIKNTFDTLGLFIGSIGIVVSAITIFIIIFINALTRQRYIGILKAVGIERQALEIAYIIQSAFYAFTGSVAGFIITFSVLVPYFESNPIDFPFSDGILSASLEGTLMRFAVLFTVTIFAGFLPAFLITKRDTLKLILGR